MSFTSDGRSWAEETFGRCELGDPRRVRRLIDFSARLSENPSGSISKVCGGDEAAQEGAYKLIENDAVRPDGIAEGALLRKQGELQVGPGLEPGRTTTEVDVQCRDGLRS